MFGKGQGVLGAWLKEFCQLVFIQTLQAFIYAIIVSFIAKIMVEGAGATMDATDSRTGLGLICVFALVSVFKIEDLVRKIFGFGPTKADHGSAVRSIAKTAFAMQLGKRVLDNGKKVVGGTGKLLKSNKDAAKARKQLAEDRADLKLDMAGGLNPEFKGEYGETHSKASFAAGSGGGSGSSSNYNQKIRALQREHEGKLKEIKEQRKNAMKDIASGVLETGGALYGATAGAIIGGADGDLEGAIQGTMAGAGLGDAAGQTIVNVTMATGGFIGRRWGNIKDLKTSGSNIRENYNNNRNSGSNRVKSIINATSKEIKDTRGQVSKYAMDVKDLDDLRKKLNSTIDNAND